ncbi:MAG: hypothetical protein WB681_13670 [Candidatus Cybelea sp.]
MLDLHVVCKDVVRAQLDDAASVLRIVEDAYRAHWEGKVVCPHSLFLRFPDSNNRIIALPSFVRTPDRALAGVKWISSFPGNVSIGLPRASALIVLNDAENGLPIGVLEGSLISAARSGAFAAIAARTLLPAQSAIRVSLIGCGLIAASVLRYLSAALNVRDVIVFDVEEDRARSFAASVDALRPVVVAPSLAEAAAACDVLVFATTASVPYVHDAATLSSAKVVLHVSLRDISEHVIADFYNVTDDKDHVLRENTSLYRLASVCPNKAAVDAELGDLLWGGVPLPTTGTTVVSPFGIGTLDVALGSAVFECAVQLGQAVRVTEFFGQSDPSTGGVTAALRTGV